MTLDGDAAPCGITYSAVVAAVGLRVLVQLQGQDRWIMTSASVPTTPPGMYGHFGGAAAPAGWLVRDGAAYSRTTYAALFAAIGTVHGAGDGSTTFNVPNALGRVDLGTGTATGAPGATAHTLGQTGGEETHALTSAENGPHTHAPLTGVNFWGYKAGGTSIAGTAATYTIATDATTGSSGSGTGHNTLPPYTAGLPCIKF